MEKLNIIITVLYKGEFPEGTVNVYADVANPECYSHKLFGQIGNMAIGETRKIVLSTHMPMDGKYSVDVTLSPSEKPFLNHIFDSENITYTVDANGREKNIEPMGDNDESMITYWLQNYKDVKYNEMVHAVIMLPENHTFEKIAVVNGKFVREYSTGTKDIYMDSVTPFKDLKVKLVKEGNLLPLAGAQDTMQEYVKFYSNDKELCTKVFCVNIDPVDDEPEYSLWMLLFTGVIPVVYFIIKKRPRPSVDNSANKYVHGTNIPSKE